MDWIVTTGSTLDAAIETALDELSVPQEDAEIEVIKERKRSVFGLRRGYAQVRARVRPIVAPPKREGRNRARISKAKNRRNQGRKGYAKTADTSKKTRGVTSGKTSEKNRKQKPEKQTVAAAPKGDEKVINQPRSAGQRRKRTIDSKQENGSPNSSNIRSSDASVNSDPKPEMPTTRRTRKIDH